MPADGRPVSHPTTHHAPTVREMRADKVLRSDGPIVVTGATGFLGRHLVPVLEDRYGADRVVPLSSADYDLLDPVAVARMIDERRPGVLVHLAAYSGGIGINKARPADFYYRNTLLTTLVFHEAARAGVSKLLYPMGGCSYPADATSPIDESQMWDGLPQPESMGYSMAKKMGIVAAWSHRVQDGLDSTVVVPGNMYGPYDNYRYEESHVIPAMVRRFYEAKRDDLGEVVMWGSGQAVRDFVYAGDVAAVLPEFIERDEPGPINISSGTTTSIRDLAELVREAVGFEGDIRWDTSKPDGQMVKIFDPSRLEKLGLSCSTPLREGLARTVEWFAAHYESAGDGLRL